MIPVLGIPILNRGDLLLRLFNSIDYPVHTLHIIANTTTNTLDDSVDAAIKEMRAAVKQGHLVKHCIIENGALYTPDWQLITRNMGVSGSWNKILINYADQDYVLIVGSDVLFTAGDLEKFDTYIRAITDRTNVGVIVGNQSYNCFGLLPETVKQVGYFDENIYPAYLEDCDYEWRSHQVGLSYQEVPDTHLIHGEAPSWGSSTIGSNPTYSVKNGTTHGQNFVYYRKKWGGDNGHEKFNRPFNDSTNPVTYWARPAQLLLW